MNNRFYHLSKVRINIGDYLILGRYGKRLLNNEFVTNVDKDGNFQKIKETVFEQIRCKVAPNAPVRTNCVYVFVDYDNVIPYRYNIYRNMTYLYGVEVVTGDTFEADYKWLDLDKHEVNAINECTDAYKKLEVTKQILIPRAINYWSQKQCGNEYTKEMLVNGSVIIKSELKRPYEA